MRTYVKVQVRNDPLVVENIRSGTCAAPNAAVELGNVAWCGPNSGASAGPAGRLGGRQGHDPPVPRRRPGHPGQRAQRRLRASSAGRSTATTAWSTSAPRRSTTATTSRRPARSTRSSCRTAAARSLRGRSRPAWATSRTATRRSPAPTSAGRRRCSRPARAPRPATPVPSALRRPRPGPVGLARPRLRPPGPPQGHRQARRRPGSEDPGQRRQGWLPRHPHDHRAEQLIGPLDRAGWAPSGARPAARFHPSPDLRGPRDARARTAPRQPPLVRTAALALLAALAAVGLGAGPAAGGRRRRRLDGQDGLERATAPTGPATATPSTRAAGRGRPGRRQPRHGAARPSPSTPPTASPPTPASSTCSPRTRSRSASARGSTPNRRHRRVQPGESVEVPFTVTVPDNATPGDYVGGIVTSLTQSGDAEGINVDRRLGIRIRLRVGGELKPSLAVEDLHVATPARQPVRQGRRHRHLHDPQHGQRHPVGPAGGVRLRPVRPGCGPRAGTIAAPPQLLPGETWKVTVPVHGVAPAVRLTATATLAPLLTDASGSTTSLERSRPRRTAGPSRGRCCCWSSC